MIRNEDKDKKKGKQKKNLVYIHVVICKHISIKKKVSVHWERKCNIIFTEKMSYTLINLYSIIQL